MNCLIAEVENFKNAFEKMFLLFVTQFLLESKKKKTAVYTFDIKIPTNPK